VRNAKYVVRKPTYIVHIHVATTFVASLYEGEVETVSIWYIDHCVVYNRPSLWSSSQEFLAANPEVPGSIPGATRFSESQWAWNGVHSALVRINEELLERKVAAPV
jgi:hypothetical protein